MCWANENWTRRWDGHDQEVLLKQEYSEQDDVDHIRALAAAFADSRYIRVNGKPLFIVYRSEAFPDIARTLETWRNEAIRIGIGELYLVRMEQFGRGMNPHDLGFDASMDFQPNFGTRAPRELGELTSRVLNKLKVAPSSYYNNLVFEYDEFVKDMLSRDLPDYKRFPSVTPDWDNSARRKENAYILTGSTPELYENWLKQTISRFKPFSPEENFIVINAWNEWAEGNHLEPDRKWGRKYLEATARALGVSY